MDKVRKAIRKGKGLKPIVPQQRCDKPKNVALNDLGAWSQVGNVLYAHPELRLGQVINICAKLGGWTQDDVFYCPDETIAKGARVFNNATIV